MNLHYDLIQELLPLQIDEELCPKGDEALW